MGKFGKKLRSLRTRRGLTTCELGELLGVNQSHVTRMEQSKRIPHVAMVVKIAAVFGITVDQLVQDDLKLE